MIMLALYIFLLSGWFNSRAALHGQMAMMQETKYHLDLARLYDGTSFVLVITSIVIACVGASKEIAL